MDQIKQHHTQTLDRFSQYFPFSKKSIQILLSISAFSFLLSLYPLLHCFSPCISTFSTKLFSYISDRNYIFLFCNGILVFLITNSAMTGTSRLGSDTNCELVKHNVDHQPSLLELVERKALATQEEIEEALATQEEIEEERAREFEDLVIERGGEHEEDDEVVDKFVIIEEDEVGWLSTEELNKKCEDFIKKMREGIKIEPQQQQLIMV